MGGEKIYVGVDVSKERLQVALRPSGEYFSKANDERAVSRLVKWLKPLGCARVVVDATGGYETVVVAGLWVAGVPVVVVNPRWVRAFAKSIGWLAKTAASMPACWRCMPSAPSQKLGTSHDIGGAQRTPEFCAIGNPMNGALKGIRVIDWTIWQQGPVATAMLADMGAEVIKIEERGKGDPGRAVMSMGGASATAKSGTNYYFEANNRHKQSITLNLTKPEAREIVYKLAEKSDVFVQNFRKGVAERLGLGYCDLRARNPRIIYANSTGYGPNGPDSGEPSFDYMAQARSGIMNIACLRTDDPIYLTGGVADQMGAIMLAYGVMTALVARERQGIGQELHASHLGSMIALQGLNVSMRTILGKEMPRAPRDDAYNPLWNHYRCADGLWLCLGMLQTDRYWKDFCRTLGIPELVDDERFKDMRARTKNHRELVAILDKIFVTKSRLEWMKILKEGGDFIYTIVNKISDLPDDPQVIANGYVVDYEHPTIGSTRLVGVPVILDETPGDPRGHAPELGEHTETILTELLGYSWDDIARLQEASVI